MKNRGFTLLEMLVVVLIIGILASIALPQYQRAVLKSRVVSLIPNANTLREAEEAYYLQNRQYISTNTDANRRLLDIRIADKKNIGASVAWSKSYVYAQRKTPTTAPVRLVMYLDHSRNFAGQTYCEALKGNAQANWVCQDALQGTLSPNTTDANYQAYLLEDF